jgi:hypothetical protein
MVVIDFFEIWNLINASNLSEYLLKNNIPFDFVPLSYLIILLA